MRITTTDIDNAFIVESEVISDERGRFARIFCDHELAHVTGERKIVQANVSCTVSTGSIRGMHYQKPPFAEMKMVRCLKGRVYDVVVDLRKNSKTFLQWHAEELTPDNFKMLIIPEGCAHGFQTLEPDTELLYFHTAYYAPEFEDGVLYNDPALKIDWPLPCYQLSERDSSYKILDSTFMGIEV